MLKKSLKALPAALLLCAPALWAANPASGELSDTSVTLDWAGSGPYVLPNATSESGEPICQPPLPLCDDYTLNVNIPDEFRELEENQRESVKIGITFDNPVPTVDYDLFIYKPDGSLLGEATASFGVQETVVVPLKTLKNGAYLVRVEPYTPMGTNFAGYAQIGKQNAKAANATLNITPQAGAAPLKVLLDARALGGNREAGAFVFEFGDSSAPVTDADGVVEHTYTSNGEYLARVRLGDTNGAKGAISAAQTVFVGDMPASGKSAASFGGAFGWAALLALAGFGALRSRRRH